jgi:hypothetical protein
MQQRPPCTIHALASDTSASTAPRVRSSLLLLHMHACMHIISTGRGPGVRALSMHACMRTYPPMWCRSTCTYWWTGWKMDGSMHATMTMHAPATVSPDFLLLTMDWAIHRSIDRSIEEYSRRRDRRTCMYLLVVCKVKAAALVRTVRNKLSTYGVVVVVRSTSLIYTLDMPHACTRSLAQLSLASGWAPHVAACMGTVSASPLWLWMDAWDLSGTCST